jgi:hypothetical protein
MRFQDRDDTILPQVVVHRLWQFPLWVEADQRQG